MNLLTDVSNAVESIPHGWTSVAKAQTMAAAVLALRPETSVEIGVFAGKGIVALGLAHKMIGRGMVYGIDPYSPTASAEGQVNDADQKFWGTLDHDAIYQIAMDNINRFGIQNSVKLLRKRSDEVDPPTNIGLLRIDGNHGEQVLKDITRYAPSCVVGALLFLDDLNWSGGAVVRAAAMLRQTGWSEIYRIDDGLVFQKRHPHSGVRLA